ncbi:hypothetical protein ABZ851_27325 [Streptomyces sp. NPDC047049]|uniref:hypothetical protein n=1 Tax=Streptomyces sp. NPDC047049 TaxID=3156688 RepID=UPI0033FFA0C3
MEDYMPSPWQIHEEGQARDVLIRACLKRFGMTYSQEQTPFAGPRTLLERRYGEPNVAMAQRYGYWMPGSDKQPPDSNPPNEAETRVLTGSVATYRGKAIPHGGCASEALRRLDGRPDVTPATYAHALSAANTMEMQSWETTRKAALVRQAEKRWSACMKARGHSFPADIFSAGDSLNSPDIRPRPAPGSKEIALAVADAQCLNDSGVVKTWYALEVRYQEKAISGDRQKWAQIREQFRTHTANTREVLRTHSGRTDSP